MSAVFDFEHGLVQTGRQRVDQVDVAGELLVLLLCHAAGDEYAQMADALVDGVDDGLAEAADFVDVFIEIENPSQRLLRRRDVVALRAEHHDRGADIAQIDGDAAGSAYVAGGEIVADEELIDNELDLLGVEIDVAAPPALEAEITLRLGVDLGIEIVLLAPQRVRRILIFEILHQPGAVEFAVTEVASQRGQPTAAEQAAAIAHRILAAHARPIGQRRAGDDDGPEQLGPDRGQHHDGPASLAIADHARLAVGLRMQRGDLFEEHGFGAGDVFDGLTRHRVGQEADEIAGMSGLERNADLTVRLEAANARAMSGARIDDDERPALRIDLDALRRNDPGQDVIDRALEGAAVEDQLDAVVEHVGRILR